VCDGPDELSAAVGLYLRWERCGGRVVSLARTSDRRGGAHDDGAGDEGAAHAPLVLVDAPASRDTVASTDAPSTGVP